jgi:signal peptidase I
MSNQSMRSVVQFAIGVVIAAVVLQTWLVLGWIVPMTVSGSSMAPTLMGPHRMYRCSDCGREFAVGLDQLPLSELAECPVCSERRAAVASADLRGERLAVDRTAFVRRGPRRWEVVVFRCPESPSDLCVKRLVGLPGETISLNRGDVFVNGQVARKSLAEQRAVRQLVDAAIDDAKTRTTQLDEVLCLTSAHWLSADSRRIEYRSLGGAITDALGYNQGAAPTTNRVSDVMLTFDARLGGAGQLVLIAANDTGRCELIVDFARREAVLYLAGRIVAKRPLTTGVESGRVVEWTFSLFDRQVLLAIGDEVVLAEPWERNQSSGDEANAPLAMVARGLTGKIERVAVWRDVYYAVRHSDGRQRGAERNGSVTWRLAAGEYFAVGDNAANSDDSRNWLSGAGLDAKLLIGKALGVR